MINLEITLDKSGNLEKLKSVGHAEMRDDGVSIACAAVSAQLRGAVRAFECCGTAILRGSADRPGSLEFSVDASKLNSDWLKGLTDVLLAGLIETEKDYPDECIIKFL